MAHFNYLIFICGPSVDTDRMVWIVIRGWQATCNWFLKESLLTQESKQGGMEERIRALDFCREFFFLEWLCSFLHVWMMSCLMKTDITIHHPQLLFLSISKPSLILYSWGAQQKYPQSRNRHTPHNKQQTIKLSHKNTTRFYVIWQSYLCPQKEDQQIFFS